MFTLQLWILIVVLLAIASLCLIIGLAALRGGIGSNPRQSSSMSYRGQTTYNGKPSRSDENGHEWND